MPMVTMVRATPRAAGRVQIITRFAASASLAVALAASGFQVNAQPVPANAPARSAFGCWRVTVPEINVHARALSYADVLAQARRGDILVKRKRACSPKGVWCLVATASGIEGFVGRAAVEQTACPPGAANAETR